MKKEDLKHDAQRIVWYARSVATEDEAVEYAERVLEGIYEEARKQQGV